MSFVPSSNFLSSYCNVSLDLVAATCAFIDLVTVFNAILTSRQMLEKLQCLYENLMSKNFCKMAVLKKISVVN